MLTFFLLKKEQSVISNPAQFTFWLMLVNNVTALFIYNYGRFIFAHWLAIVTLLMIVSGYLVTKNKRFRYWMQVHIACMVVGYYLLIGGAINEAFLHIEDLKKMMLNQSPVYGLSHFLAMFFFIGLLIFYLIKYKSFVKINR